MMRGHDQARPARAGGMGVLLCFLIGCGSESQPPAADGGPSDARGGAEARAELSPTDAEPELTPIDAPGTGLGDEVGPDGVGEVASEAGPAEVVGVDGAGLELAPPTSCQGLPELAGTLHEASAAVQDCIDGAPSGATLTLPPGRFLIARQILLARPLYLTTRGKSESDPPCEAEDVAGQCFTLVASPDFLISDPAQPGLLWVSPSAAGATLDHLIFDGNNLARLSSVAAARCTGAGLTEAPEITYGYNVTLAADGVRLLNSVSRNALCGTGMEVDGKRGLTIVNNRFADNGLHDRFLLWADGLTVTDAVDSVITDNHASDNSDIDIILGGCRGCTVQRNLVTHSDRQESSSFAALMLTVWPPPSVPRSTGDFTGADIAWNQIDCGPGKRCGFGLNIGTDAWVPDGPLGGGAVHDNRIRNAQQGLNVAHTTATVRLYDNVVEACGGSFVTACGQRTLGAYNISPTSVVDRSEDDVSDAAYTHEDWTGCLPNP